MEYKELYEMARLAMTNSYSPYSHFAVGAALLTKSGLVFTGCNVENAAFGETICAERVAITKAISEGEREFVAIAIASAEGEAWPCGACRQVMHEFAKDIIVITGKSSDELEVLKLSDIFLKGFEL